MITMCGNYIVGNKISSGTYSIVYNAINKRTKQHVAIKFSKKIENRSTLLNEARIMIHLRRSVPIPRIRDYGIYKNDINYLAMDLLGKPLYFENIHTNDMQETPSKHMNIKVLNISLQLFNIIKQLHDNGFIYRDIKPSNFLMGQPPNQSKIYLIDLGFVKHISNTICNNNTQKITPIGTIDYMSINTHNGYEQTKNDDLESLAYLFYYMHNGSLPWSKLTEHSMIAKEKKESDEFKRKCPTNVINYMKLVKDFERNEIPDYNMLYNTLSHVIIF